MSFAPISLRIFIRSPIRSDWPAVKYQKINMKRETEFYKLYPTPHENPWSNISAYQLGLDLLIDYWFHRLVTWNHAPALGSVLQFLVSWDLRFAIQFYFHETSDLHLDPLLDLLVLWDHESALGSALQFLVLWDLKSALGSTLGSVGFMRPWICSWICNQIC